MEAAKQLGQPVSLDGRARFEEAAERRCNQVVER
jgi:hypothetical protein